MKKHPVYSSLVQEPPEEKTEDVANAGAGKFVASSLLFSNAAKASGCLIIFLKSWISQHCYNTQSKQYLKL